MESRCRMPGPGRHDGYESWGFYAQVHKSATIEDAEKVKKAVVSKALRVCEITGAEWRKGELIVKLLSPGEAYPDSEPMLTIGWKILLTAEQRAKIEEAGL